MVTKVVFIKTTGAGTWTAPVDFNPANNSIVAIGAGGGGGASAVSGAGGGEWAMSVNVALAANATAYYNVAQGGAAGANGGDTWFNKDANSAPASAASGVRANGGKQFNLAANPGYSDGGTGGVGTTKNPGGRGVCGSYSGGGGGAGSALGPGRDGGFGSAGPAAGGGGAAGGGSNGADAITTTGGLGGNNPNGTDGGAPGAAGAGRNGFPGAGGGGGGSASGAGGAGAPGREYQQTSNSEYGGAGGGGGGEYSDGTTGGYGGLYGGGAGSRRNATGGQGILIITYEAVEPPTFSGTVPNITGAVGTALVALSPTVTSYFTNSPTAWTPTPALPAGITLNASTGNPQGTPSAAGIWTGTITGSNGTAPDAVSNSFTITIEAAPTAPSITAQPENQSAAADSTATFSATATGSGLLAAQWKKNGTSVGGAAIVTSGVSFSYTTPTLTPADNGAVYSVVVTGSVAPSATSSNATLTVTTSVTPQFPGALALTLLSTTGYTLSWTAATDDVAVTGYERSLNGGTDWTDIGLVLTTNVSGRTPGSTDACRIRAYDIDGHRSAPLARSVTLALTQVVSEPLENDGGTLHLNAAVKWSWFPGGRLGAMEGITPLDGTSTTHATVGNLVIDGLPLGPGVLMTCVWGATPDLDSVHYQYLTVV